KSWLFRDFVAGRIGRYLMPRTRRPSTQANRRSSRESGSPMFYLIAIFLVIASPLAVPVAVSIVHAISNWKQNAAPALSRPVRPAFGPALRGAVPAAA